MKGILCVLIVVAQGGGGVGAREWVDINLVFVVVVFLQCVAILRKLKERIS